MKFYDNLQGQNQKNYCYMPVCPLLLSLLYLVWLAKVALLCCCILSLLLFVLLLYYAFCFSAVVSMFHTSLLSLGMLQEVTVSF